MVIELDDGKTEQLKPKIIKRQTFDPSVYEIEFPFQKNESPTFENARTFHEMVQVMEANPKIQIEADLVGFNTKKKKFEIKTVTDRNKFMETVRASSEFYGKRGTKFFSMRESDDSFARDQEIFGNLIGDDFIPLLGGPFFKQLYLQDYLKQQALAFYAYHHDPIAREGVNIIVNFTLGRGWKVKFKDPKHQAYWDAFEQVNDLKEQMSIGAKELSVYGENMFWKLPNNALYIGIDLPKEQLPPTGLIPRIRLFDPSAVWEIVTYPEDITRVLFYQVVTPTQYQIYTGSDQGRSVPTAKFIFKQIPAEEMIHTKINCLSNEKRGRSDLAPIFGYLKRLRDSINYRLAGEQKNAAWSIDTSIEGSQKDIDDYVAAQQALGTIPPAGSEFVHTSKIKREYMANTMGKGGVSETFDWCLSMIAAGLGIPVNYFGTHLSGGQTRASAIIATEPVAKKFEERQAVYRTVLERIKEKVFPVMGLPANAEMEVIFPNLYTQDRSNKLKDLALGELQGWLSKETAATIAGKELGLDEYNYALEQGKIKKDAPEATVDPTNVKPLTSPPAIGQRNNSVGGLSSSERNQVKDANSK